MTDQSRAEHLVAVWEQARDRGVRLTPAQVCADAPELIGLVEELIRRLYETPPPPPPPPPPAPLPPPPIVPGFRVIRLLGRGGFGSVWLAEDLNLGREVALKVLRMPDADWQLAALRDEARRLATLDHPNVMRVFAWVDGSDGPVLVLRYVSGGSFADRLKAEGRLPWERAAGYASDVADGLRAVHRTGVLHRDVKPANVLWDAAADDAVLTDFGIACQFGLADRVAGSLPYLPPEAADGVAGPANDVYALAVTLFELCTGEQPFRVRSMADVRTAVSAGLAADDPRLGVVPRPLDELIRTALHPDPARRPPLDEFAARLRGLTNQLLTDALAFRSAVEPGAVRIEVFRDDAGVLIPLPTTRLAERATRDVKRVPPPAERVGVRTGDRVRVRVRADRPGYLTVFNVGPTGNLNFLWPDDPSAGGGRVAPGALDVLDAELTPPAGREKIVAVLSDSPLPVRFSDWGSIGPPAGVPDLYRVTRDLQRLAAAMQGSPAGECVVTVIEVDHQP